MKSIFSKTTIFLLVIFWLIAPNALKAAIPTPIYTNSFSNQWGSILKTTNTTQVASFGALNSFVAPKEWHLISCPTLAGVNGAGSPISHVLYYQDAQTNLFCVTCYDVASGTLGSYSIMAIKQGR
jgi:hypothetical protein